MSGRLSGMKGGGFLNNVDGVLLDYEFTNIFPGTEAADPNDPQLFAVLTFMEDGKTEPTQTTLRGGSLKFLEIADQHTVVNPEGNQARIWDKSDLYHFLSSVEAAGVADGGLDDTDLDRLSFTSLIGRRMRLAQENDEARMAARAAKGDNPKRVVVKDGVTKEYPYTRLIAETVYDGVAAKTPAVSARGTGAGAGSARKVSPGPAKAGASSRPTLPVAAKGSAAKLITAAGAKTAVFDLDAESQRVLSEILAANGNSIQRSEIQMLILRGYTGLPNREAIRKRIFSEEFLSLKGKGWEFNQPAQTITLN